METYPDDPRPCVEDTKEGPPVLNISPWTVDVRLRVDTYPDDPKPCIELIVFENPEEFDKIPATVDVRDRVDIYPDDPKPT